MAINGAFGDRDADGHAGRAADGKYVGFDAEGEEGLHPSALRANLPTRARLRAAVCLR